MQGLLFIPDISGFTKFVNETDIEHSRLIIQELLEVLINSNELDLEVSEIEGDAILFYKFGEAPDLETLYRQVEKMFCAFHQHLNIYDRRKFCHCKACLAAIELTLKIITHYGEFSTYPVKNFNKLIGKDVIVAHQLLKNDISEHEYWLLTDNVKANQEFPQTVGWMKWDRSWKNLENLKLPFYYAQLTELKSRVPSGNYPPLDLTGKRKIISLSRQYATDLITLFHACGDFQYRSQWQEGVASVEEISHILPRIGTKCKMKLRTGETIVYSNSYLYSSDRIEFSKSYEGTDIIKHYILEKNDMGTKLTLDYYTNKNLLSLFGFTGMQKEAKKKELQSSLIKLENVVRRLQL